MTSLLKTISPVKLTFGGASISGEGGGYGFGAITKDQANRLLRYAYDLGVRIFDTAPIYGFRESEKRMGLAFKQMREKVFIVSKCGVSWHDNKRVNMSNEPKVVNAMLENTLKDLGSSYVDLYMIHWPDKNVDIRFPMEVLSKAKNEGKIKHIGLCNTNREDLELACEVDHIEVIQSELNLFNREVVDQLGDVIKSRRMSFMSWGTLDKGILTGHAYKGKKYDAFDLRGQSHFKNKTNLDFKFNKFIELKKLCDKYKILPLDLAIHHNLSYEIVDQVIIGCKNESQLDEVFESVNKKIERVVIERALEVIDNG